MLTNHEKPPAKHSPGPWKANLAGAILDANNNEVAHVIRARDLHLIAAGPELLAACKKKLTAQMLRETALSHELYTARDSAMQAAEEAEFEADEFMRAAIAKAEGK